MEALLACTVLSLGGLHGALVPCILRSAFSSSGWGGPISPANLLPVSIGVSPFRSFTTNSGASRSRDLLLDLSGGSGLLAAAVSAMAFVALSDSSIVFTVLLTGSELSTDSTSPWIVRGMLFEPDCESLQLGAANHYSLVPLARLPRSSMFSEAIYHSSRTIPSQLCEQILRLGLSVLPGAHPIWLLKCALLAVILCTGLLDGGREVAALSGPLETPDSEDSMGCLARLLPLLWYSDRLGFLALWRALASSTTKVGSDLLDTLLRCSSRSNDKWALALREVRSADFAGPSLELQTLAALTTKEEHSTDALSFIPAPLLQAMGSAFLEASRNLSEWLRASKDANYGSSHQVYLAFTQARSPCETQAGNYLGGTLSMQSPLNTGVSELMKTLSPPTLKISASLFNKWWESSDRLNVHSSGGEHSTWFSEV